MKKVAFARFLIENLLQTGILHSIPLSNHMLQLTHILTLLAYFRCVFLISFNESLPKDFVLIILEVTTDLPRMMQFK